MNPIEAKKIENNNKKWRYGHFFKSFFDEKVLFRPEGGGFWQNVTSKGCIILESWYNKVVSDFWGHAHKHAHREKERFKALKVLETLRIPHIYVPTPLRQP